LELPEVLLLLPALAAERRPRDDVVRQLGQRLAEVHDRGRRRCGGHDLDEAHDLVLLDGLDAAHLPRAQKLDHAHLAHLPPVLAVGREDEAFAAGAHDVNHGAARTGREGEVVRLEHLRGSLRGGHDHGGHLAEPEQHQRAVPARQAEQAPVRQLRAGEVVQAADDRQVPWTWGKLGSRVLSTQRLRQDQPEENCGYQAEDSVGEVHVHGHWLTIEQSLTHCIL
jgi:hypothetical protein